MEGKPSLLLVGALVLLLLAPRRAPAKRRLPPANFNPRAIAPGTAGASSRVAQLAAGA